MLTIKHHTTSAEAAFDPASLKSAIKDRLDGVTGSPLDQHELVTGSDGGARVSLNPNVTATVINPNLAAGRAAASAHELNRKFLETVLVWPDPQGPGYVNLHLSKKNTAPSDNSHKNNGGKDWVTGRPYRKIEDFISRYMWAESTDIFRNTWMCMSQQSDMKLNSYGQPKAVRLSKNALWVNSIWIDCDVKKDDLKHYATITEALKALAEFWKKVRLPNPTAIVHSGGGLHIYWTQLRPLRPAEWKLYADGLKALLIREGVKCDIALTSDIARLLRVPGTLNHKYDPPRRVRVLHLGRTYDFDKDMPCLKDFQTPDAQRSQLPSSKDLIEPSAIFDTPDPIFNTLDVSDTSLQDGILPTEARLLDPRPIFARNGCPLYREALRDGGAKHDNPLWNLLVLGTVFMANGEKIAQKISMGHATYTPDETRALYDRKLKDWHDKGVGYPSCRAIEGSGSPACAGCHHRSRIKSPLNLSASINSSSQPQKIDKPNGYQDDPLNFSLVAADEAVDRINAAGFFVLTSNGDIYRQDAGGSVSVQKLAGFNNLFACRNARVGSEVISAGYVWKTSPSRREYSQIGYWPGGQKVPQNSYNMWRGWGVQAVAGDSSVILNHIFDVVAGGDQAKANFILDWSAHMIQRPLEKPGVALVLKGKKGTGKTILTQLLVRCIGTKNALVTADGKQLFGQFTWHLADKLLIVAEEAFFVGNRELNDKLKHLLTGDNFEAEQKYGQRINMKSLHRMIMASNHDQVVAASDDERRFVVCDVSDAKLRDDAYFAPLVKIIKGEDVATLAAFMHHLQTRDISDFMPERAARTVGERDLAQQKLLGLEPPLQWLLEAARALREAADPLVPRPPELRKSSALDSYRRWVNTARIRGASDFNSAELFWKSIKRLLNPTIFPGRKLFRSSGGERFVCLPPMSELVEGFNRLLGAAVVDVDGEDCG